MAGRRGSIQIVPGPKYVPSPDDAPMFGRLWSWRQKHSQGRYFRQNVSGIPIRPSCWAVTDRHQGDECDDHEPEVIKPLSVKKVDLLIEENAIEHHTSEYDHCCQDQNGPYNLVIRRGQKFDIQVEFHRPFDEEQDVINLRMEIGKSAKPSKGTLQELSPAKKLMPRKWSAEVKNVENNIVTLTLQTAPTAFIGKWQLSIVTVLNPKEEEHKGHEEEDHEKPKKMVEHYRQKDPIYLIFNPWCKDDQVYMPDEEDRKEFVECDVGKIYSGNYRQIGSKPWSFGQYEDFMLDCSMYLLEKSGTAVTLWNNPVPICRAISRIINAEDDEGVLEGNWSGNYSGGTRPTAWVSSSAIIEEYWREKKPVKFGQCWVFSGLCTAICRCLGLPCRCITNFSSAHDCDGSVTIDYHYKKVGDKYEKLDEWNEDSVWNFHVWNECWMARPDIGPHYAGWQAFDATPQETSEGSYQAGPCPVNAIKRGDLTVPFDAPFIFAEVNSDKVHWFLDDDGTWTHKIFRRHTVGRCISTKCAGKDDRNDVTNDYKFGEGTEEERAAVYRASLNSVYPWVYDNQEEDDVTFTTEDKDFIQVGSNFDITVKMQNKSRAVRTVHGSIMLSASYYTGVPLGRVKMQEFDIQLDAIKSGEANMRVTCEEYLHLVVEQVSFKVSVLCKVGETNQIYADDDTFRLRRPDIAIKVPLRLYNRKDFDATLTLSNPLPVSLTECEWIIEGSALDKKIRVQQKDVESYEKVQLNVTLKSKRAGKSEIMASFSSKELADVTGSCCVEFRKE